jgi:hypothetical protein
LGQSKNAEKLATGSAAATRLARGGSTALATRRPSPCTPSSTARAKLLPAKRIEMALAGDTTALRLVMERLIPPTRERRVFLDLPKIEMADGITKAIANVLEAVAAGKIMPSEGQSLAGLIEAMRKIPGDRRVGSSYSRVRKAVWQWQIESLQRRVQRLGGVWTKREKGSFETRVRALADRPQVDPERLVRLTPPAHRRE